MTDIIALEPIAIRPVDQDLIDAAGEPGTPARVMVSAALGILARRPVWTHHGRGVGIIGSHECEAYDHLGFVRAAAQEVSDGCRSTGETLADYPDYPAAWNLADSLYPAEMYSLLSRWGMVAAGLSNIRPGDVVVFNMGPGAHLAVVVAAPDADNLTLKIAHAYWARAATMAWLGSWWRERLVGAMRWPGRI